MAQSPVHFKETHTQTSSGMFLYHRYFIVHHERMPQDDYDNDDYDNDDKGNDDENSATLKAKNVIQLGWASSKPCPPFPQGIVLARISPSCYTYSNESGLIFLVSIRNIGSDPDCGLNSGIYIETLGGNYSEFLRLYRDILHDVTK